MRLFVAVDIPYNEKIGEVQAYIKKCGKVKIVEKENLHITLKFLGEVDEEKLQSVVGCIENVCSHYKKFQISLKGVGAFPNISRARVIWIGVEEGREILSEIMQQLDNCFQKLGFKKERSYVPHLTIARVKSFIKFDFTRYHNENFGKLIVKEIKLKKSTLTPKGPIYEDLYTAKIQE